MAIRNPLQEQLLKAGLVNKNKVDQVARQQQKARDGKPTAKPETEAVDAQKLAAERAERDRQLEAERKAQKHAQELQAQIRQIVESQRIKPEGEIEYRFADGNAIKSMLVNPALRSQLARGQLVIVRFGAGHAMVPRAAADKVRERDPGAIVLDHASGAKSASTDADPDADYYKQFEVPDDLVW
jgi:uncharacterized protein YaiL (DUF2058 family)